MQQAAHARSKSRNDAVERRRYVAAPVVVQLLCTSAQLDPQPVWCVLRHCPLIDSTIRHGYVMHSIFRVGDVRLADAPSACLLRT